MKNLSILAIVFIHSISLFAQPKQAPLKIEHLTENFYIYTTYHLYQNEPVQANGMYLVTKEGVVLFDTPWDTTQFQPLLDSIEYKHHKKVILCIATHFHDDKTAGLEYYKLKGIKTYTTVLTDQWSEKRNMKRADNLISNDTLFSVGGYRFKTFYPGEGHTADNIVIWFEKERLLIAGCLIKGSDAENLGFLGDANPAAYATTVQRVIDYCKNPKYVVITHSPGYSPKTILHTLKLAKELPQK